MDDGLRSYLFQAVQMPEWTFPLKTRAAFQA